ncbi:hypothetical protein EJ05DRAFT_10538 [Pseudovirgaria hyperparasitica]|uniref:Uncharacterized protein n=1 Tax=Pseudovirgaria hyperparasitica TaxID=470096 RepID=A0A6A6WKJ8_9PEZI|nr:uncharacterized protein EJ05DRAFT_10538 [Pseudovirgaria hyperparasitica]KAF2762720.1 hypothetical protein EJ05DRAFT_10538 [Pseudovirgaria hyperparasitica]
MGSCRIPPSFLSLRLGIRAKGVALGVACQCVYSWRRWIITVDMCWHVRPGDIASGTMVRAMKMYVNSHICR